MTKRIFRSILLVAGIVLSASVVLIMGFLYDHFSRVQEDQLWDELFLAARGVEKSGQSYLEALVPRTSRLTWVGADGTVLYDTGAPAAAMENHRDREEITSALKSGTGSSTRYSATMTERTIYCAMRLEDGTALRLSTSYASVWGLAMVMLQPMLLVLLLAMVLSGILARRVARRIVEPLNRLDLDRPLENEAYEEIAPVLGCLDRQQKQINAQIMDLKRSKSEFSQIIDNMTEGLVLLNDKGEILSINPAASEVFHTGKDSLQKSFVQVERTPEISRSVRTALSGKHSEMRFQRDGKEMQLAVSPISQDGLIIGAVILTCDVTERAFVERKRREFTANVSHELKTPLQSLSAGVEIMEKGLVKPEDTPRFVGHIRTEARRLMTLIEDIIRLSELDEGEEISCEEVDLRKIADSVAESLSDVAAARNVTLTVSGESAPLLSVHRLLVEILYNLCDNAIKYNVDGGSVDVTVERTASGAAVTVRDTGIGIPPEHQGRVFERFFRVDKSHSRSSGGTGLGLSIVKHAVQVLGGNIDLRSKPGEGTSIKVFFLAAADEQVLKLMTSL